MFPGAKIIAIDDQEDDLKAIVDALRALGQACLSYQYPIEQLPADGGFEGIRLLITDVNLVGLSSPGNEALKIGPVISLIERIISENNGPYALITWSDQGLHDVLVKRIAAASTLKNKQPFFAKPLPKPEFLDNRDKLKDAIAEIPSENAPFGALLDWESRVSSAGQNVLRTISSLSLNFPGDTLPERLDRTLSKLATDAFGVEHTEAHRFEAVNEALFPLLNDELNREFFSGGKDELWNRAITKHGDSAPVPKADIPILNTAIFFEPHNGFARYRRGVVMKLPDTWLEPQAFEKRFGVTPDELGKQFFKTKDGAEIVWVLAQTQAACDFAHPKLGPIPYCLGAFIKPSDISKSKDPPSYVWKSPPLAGILGTTDIFCLFLALLIPVPLTRVELEEVGFTVVGRLKDQVSNYINFAQAHQMGRPGLIVFS